MRNSLQFEGAFTVETQGHRGGISYQWRHNDEVKLQSFIKNHIDLIVESREGHKFRLTGIYRETNRSKRRETLELIRMLANENNLPCGDMNNVMNQ